ncbi:MAG TPA: ABC transporter permease [Candidatus Dormibacteraeota bacterium]|nr:ABC transporter permease [Candidatus Dormibacteraeota bacterium]
MPLLVKVRSFLRNLFLSRGVEVDLDQELYSHLELLTEENTRAGMPPEEAQRAARIELGGIEQVKEQVRDQGLGNWLHSVVSDCRYGLRQLRKNPSATAVMVFTLALAIGATTAIFSVVYGVLLRPLPYPDSSRIMAVFEVNSKGTWSRVADPNFDDFRDQNRSFQAIAKYNDNTASVSGTSRPTRTTIAGVSPDFLKVFGVQPTLGRDFSASDAKKGAGPTVLVSYGYWRQYLGSSPDLSQSHLKIDGAVFSVIGVLPAGFHFPPDVDLWLPADLDGENPSRTSHNYNAVGRLRDVVTVQQANQDISAIARRIHDTSSEPGDYLLKDGIVVPLQDSITVKARPALLVLLGAVGFLLLVACANVANLLLAQASVRERELAVRSALGAARGRLIRQFLTEAFLLALAGGGLGVLGALGGVAGLLSLAPGNLPRLGSVSISIPVLVFAFLLSTAVAGGLGAFTATRATSGDLRKGLVEGGREQAGSQGSQRVGQVIVAAQIAITFVLVVGAGLLGRSLMKVLEVNPGFRVDKIVTMDVSLRWVGPKAKAGQAIFFSNLIDRLKQIPGVRNVGATSVLPMVDGGLPDGMFLLMTQNEIPKTLDGFGALFQQKERIGFADFCVATDGYFQVLGIPLIRGRIFDARDGANSPHVAVISESLARARWPNQDPIGHTIEFGNMDGDLRLLTIVGIVGDTHQYGLDAPPRPTVYVNLFQRPRAAITLTMLSDADTGSVASAARGLLQDLNPEIPARFRTFSQIYSASLGSRRFNVMLIGFFGITALLLATAGVFGVMAYSVSRRTREIGVRVALGAGSADVLRMILSQGLRTIFIGVAIGIAGSLALTRSVESLLFGVTATDPLTFGGVILVLVGAALLACYIPARRATRVDPMVALRYE